MKVEVKKISLENYKKFPSKSVDLFPRTEISGRNREGKSTLQDAYLDVLTGKMANGTEDTSSLESKKQELNAELSKLEEQERILEDSAKGYDSLSYEIRGLKSSRDGLVSKANEWLRARQKFISDTVSELMLKKSENESSIRIIGMELDNHIREAQQAKADLDRARKDYPRIKEMEWDDSGLKAIEAETFNDSDTICPTCGKELPEEQISELRASFEEKKKFRIENELTKKQNWESAKQNQLKGTCDLGNSASAKLKKTNEEINKLQSEIGVAQDEVAELTKQIEEEQSKFTELPESVDMKNDEEYLAVTARISEFEEKLKSFDDVPGKKQELRMQISNVMKQISNVDADIKIAQAAVTEKEKRVAELNEELKRLGQVQADIEKNIDTVLNFSIQKNKALAEKINPYFKHFQFSFLDYTIEGNPVETCKMICNGIDYNSGLNHSDKILCEVDLLNGLQEMNGLNMPIWIDDSESIDKSRIPVLNRQMIVLRVTDGDLTAKEL